MSLYSVFGACWFLTTLRGLNFADHSIRKILTPSRGFNFADGPFRNILRISSMGLVQTFSQITRIDKAVLVPADSKTRKTKVQTPEEETEGGSRYVNHVFFRPQKEDTICIE